MSDNDEMRESFEAFAKREGMSLDMYKSSYLSDETYSAWKAWQAAQAEQAAELDALLNAARALDALLDRELHVLDKEVVFPFESHTQAWNHIVDARQIASEAAAIAKERKA